VTNPAPEELKSIFSKSLELLQEGRTDDWVALFAEDGVLEFVYAPPGFPPVMRGTEALRIQMSVMPQQLRIDYGKPVFHAVSEDGVLVAEFTGDCTLLATGAQYRQDYLSVVRFEDGLITHYRDFWNPWLPMAAIGGEAAWNQALQALAG
jgi:ketosteroid isomerase-like protein